MCGHEWHSRVADGLDNPLRVGGEHEHAGKIEKAVLCSKIQVFEEPGPLHVSLWKFMLVRSLQKIAEGQRVKLLYACTCRNFIRVKLMRTLKQTLQLFPGIDTSFVRAVFEPDNTVFVKVWFVQSLRYAQKDKDSAILKDNIFCLYADRTADQIGGCI